MDTEIISTIWHWTQAPQTMRWAGTIDRHHNDFFTEHRNPTRFEESPGKDMFFAPLAFENSRTNESARGLSVLFADLDQVWNLKNQLHKYWPHVLWLTSNHNAQAVWLLRSEEANINAWSDLNQRMTYFMGADKGGWHASKLLRVPGSLNWKYDPPQKGITISFQPKAAPYEAEVLRAALPQMQVLRPKLELSCPNPILLENWKTHLAKIWKDVPLSTRSDLLAAGMKDRSAALVRASNKMHRAGISPEDQFHALYWVAWNKFQNRPEMLWSIVNYHT
jgi:hypothetical protein